jgi:hypothetical protein
MRGDAILAIIPPSAAGDVAKLLLAIAALDAVRRERQRIVEDILGGTSPERRRRQSII